MLLNPYFKSNKKVLNPYFSYNGENFSNINEQNLVQGLIREHIEQFGVKGHYILRQQNINKDEIFGEIYGQNFTHCFETSFYMESPDGMMGRDSIRPFGYLMNDTITLQVPFDKIVSQIEELNIDGRKYPLAGDLIHLQMFGNLLEIRYVEDKSPSFMTGRWHIYTFSCQIFDLGSETFTTDIPEIDVINEFDEFYEKPNSDNEIIQEESNMNVIPEPNVWKELMPEQRFATKR